jgi:hypothetical protein
VSRANHGNRATTSDCSGRAFSLPSPLGGEGLGVRGQAVFSPPNCSPPKGRGE